MSAVLNIIWNIYLEKNYSSCHIAQQFISVITLTEK